MCSKQYIPCAYMKLLSRTTYIIAQPTRSQPTRTGPTLPLFSTMAARMPPQGRSEHQAATSANQHSGAAIDEIFARGTCPGHRHAGGGFRGPRRPGFGARRPRRGANWSVGAPNEPGSARSFGFGTGHSRDPTSGSSFDGLVMRPGWGSSRMHLPPEAV